MDSPSFDHHQSWSAHADRIAGLLRRAPIPPDAAALDETLALIDRDASAAVGEAVSAVEAASRGVGELFTSLGALYGALTMLRQEQEMVGTAEPIEAPMCPEGAPEAGKGDTDAQTEGLGVDASASVQPAAPPDDAEAGERSTHAGLGELEWVGGEPEDIQAEAGYETDREADDALAMSLERLRCALRGEAADSGDASEDAEPRVQETESTSAEQIETGHDDCADPSEEPSPEHSADRMHESPEPGSTEDVGPEPEAVDADNLAEAPSGEGAVIDRPTAECSSDSAHAETAGVVPESDPAETAPDATPDQSVVGTEPVAIEAEEPISEAAHGSASSEAGPEAMAPSSETANPDTLSASAGPPPPMVLSEEDVAAMSAGDPPPPTVLPEADLAAASATASVGPVELTPEQVAAMLADEQQEPEWGSRPLSLDSEKIELLQFMVNDMNEHIEQIGSLADEAASTVSRPDAAEQLSEVSSSITETSRFFEFGSLDQLASMLGSISTRITLVPDVLVPEIVIRLRAIGSLLEQFCAALQVGMELIWPLSTLEERLNVLLDGGFLKPVLIGWHNNDPERLLELDGVAEGVDPPPMIQGSSRASDEETAEAAAAMSIAEPTGGEAESGDASAEGTAKASQAMVRVPAEQIDQLVAITRHLVMSKNRLAGLHTRAIDASDTLSEELGMISGDVHRLTGELQAALMATRMVRVDHALERYGRTVQDVAHLYDKEIVLEIAGGETLVEKSQIDALTSPLNSVMRYLASSVLETPEQRRAADLPPTGTILVEAENRGTEVIIAVSAEGTPPDPEAIETEAATFGVGLAPGQGPIELMMDPGYATSPIAGLGQLVQIIGATASLHVDDRRVSIVLTLPVASAVIPSMMVGVGGSRYAIPLRAVIEVVRPSESRVHEVNGQPVVRLRDAVIPLVDLPARLGHRGEAEYAVVVTVGTKNAALGVSSVIGQSEIVVEPLADEASGSGPFSGATICEDGGVSLILDIQRVLSEAVDGDSRVDRC